MRKFLISICLAQYKKSAEQLFVSSQALSKVIKKIENELDIQVPDLKTVYLGMVEGQARITEYDENYIDYCVMKGFLQEQVRDLCTKEVYLISKKK